MNKVDIFLMISIILIIVVFLWMFLLGKKSVSKENSFFVRYSPLIAVFVFMACMSLFYYYSHYQLEKEKEKFYQLEAKLEMLERSEDLNDGKTALELNKSKKKLLIV